MPRRPARPALAAAALACLAAPAARAQGDELPAERARREARDRARAAALGVDEAFQRYGRGAPVSPSTAADNAWARLDLDPHVVREEGPPPDPLPDDAQAEPLADHLRRMRRAVLIRLWRLDPDRHPFLGEPPEREQQPPPASVRLVDVQDLVLAPEDHEAPAVGLGAGARAADPAGELADHGVSSDLARFLDADTLVELLDAELQAVVTAGRRSVEVREGRLVLRLPPAGHAAVDRLLARLRQARAGLVDLDVRVYRLAAAVFAELRPEALGLSPAGEERLARAEREGQAVRLAAHRTVAHDGQRVVVRRGQTRAAVVDLETNQTGVVPVQDPVVRALLEGLVVELRPVVDRRGGRVLLDVALSLGRLAPDPERRAFDGIEVELPELAVARTTSTGVTPLGRGALLGGALTTAETPADAQPVVVYVRPQLVQARR